MTNQTFQQDFMLIQSRKASGILPSGTIYVDHNPAIMSSMFQDSAGTIPVTANGDPIGMIRDQSGNNYHAIQTDNAKRPTYGTGGGLHWINYTGTTYLEVPSMPITDGAGAHCSLVAAYVTSIAGYQPILGSDVGGNRISQLLRLDGATIGTIAFNTIVNPFQEFGPATVAATTPFVGSQRTASATTEAFKNNIGNGSIAVTGTMISGSNPLVLGGDYVGGISVSAFITGRIYRNVHLARDWTAPERALLHTIVGASAGLVL